MKRPEVIGAESITWAGGINPPGQTITVPAGCTAAYMFWTYWNGSAGYGLLSGTLAGLVAGETDELVGTTQTVACGVCAWYKPSEGPQTLDVAWDAVPSEGSTCTVVYVRGGALGWRDMQFDHNISATVVSASVVSVQSDLVLKHDQRWDANAPLDPPSLSTGWVSWGTHFNNNEGSRTSSINSTVDGLTVCNSENESYSSISAISIPAMDPVRTSAFIQNAKPHYNSLIRVRR